MCRTPLIFVALGMSAFAVADFSIYGAETPAAKLGANTALYGGVQRYDFGVSGGAPTVGPGIPAPQLSDPAGLVFWGGKLHVGNRHGNTLGIGSITSFPWDGLNLGAGSVTASSAVTIFQGWSGFGFAPGGDIFVTTLNGGTRRFRFLAGVYVDIDGVSSGSVRDAWISPDGLKLIETKLPSTLRVSDVTPGGIAFSSDFTVNSGNNMHQMAMRNGELYVTSFSNSKVIRVTLGGTFVPFSSKVVADAPSALGIAFSPDGNEMFVSGHTSNVISRFVISGIGTWIPNGTIATGKNMGYLAVIDRPGPAVRIRGQVELNDCVGSIHGGTLSVDVFDGSTFVETLTCPLGAGGTFAINPTETSGTRSLVFQTRSGLRKAVTVTLQPTPVTGLVIGLTNGDVDNSSEVDAADIDIVIASFGATNVTNPDVDCSGEVDAADIDVVIANFGAVGD